jgi:hypothetical protein
LSGFVSLARMLVARMEVNVPVVAVSEPPDRIHRTIHVVRLKA